MAQMQQAKIFLDSYDLTGDANAVALELGAEKLPATAFGADTRVGVPGLKTFKGSIAGFVRLGLGLTEEFLSSKLALADVPLTVVPTLTAAEGDPSFSVKCDLATYTPWGGKVGDISQFTLEAEATSAEAVRGQVIHNATRSTSGNGTVFNLGAAAAGKSVFATLHLLALAGTGTPTLTAKIQSAALVGFGSPTDRITFPALTAVGSQWGQLLGPVTDGFWRVIWTLSGTGPSALFLVTLGIQ